jgi:predicted DNA-binding transcriptional regulator AlpA
VRFFLKCPWSAAQNPEEKPMTIKVAEPAACAPLEPLLTNEDLERLLGIHRRTVARLCERGLLPPPLKLGGSNRWRAEDVADAIEMLRTHRVRPQMKELVSVA